MFPCRSSRARRLYRQCALAAVGIQQFPELSSFEGVDVVGPLPSELQEHIEEWADRAFFAGLRQR
jgi:hypothetical protein